MAFVHLHVHSEYSLLDGACRIHATRGDGEMFSPLMERVKALGQDAVALTDHGVMYGAVEFYKAAKRAGIHPVIGCEVYVAARTRADKQYGIDNEHHHLVLLVENEEGYQNLIALVSKAFTEGFYGKPRIDRELLQLHHEGLIALSGCLSGEIPHALSSGDYDKAKEAAAYYARLFGEDHFYIELQDHFLPEQRRITPQLIRIARELGLPLVCTNDAHYLSREDAELQKVLVCIQTATTLQEPSSMVFPNDEFYLKSEDEMRALFSEFPEAIDNTARIAARCRFDFTFGQLQLPAFDAPGGDSVAYFRSLCREGLAEKYGPNPSEQAVSRLRYETDMIERMGYVDYYLIVRDYVMYAKTHDIPVGPGRGSGAASLAAYCIGITGIDPLKYDLLFERFLNPERVSMPDFDVDFCNEKRQQVIDYVIRKYGTDHVAQIVTFGTMAARAAVRDIARVMSLPYSLGDTVAKRIPRGQNMQSVTLQQALETSAPLRELYDTDPRVRDIIEMAKKVEGMPRNASTHAAGIVITAQPVDHYVPLCVNGDAVATQFTMTTLEELGLLKMDFLGLRNLTIIDGTVKRIQKRQPDFDLSRIDLECRPVYEMFSHGETVGVFQFESSGMKRVLRQLGPERFEDLIAVIALYRPGPMASIPKYVYNRHHPEAVTYIHPLLAPILSVTYGCVVYQEQVMQILRALAGYSLGRADIVRRAMSKKKHDVMQRERDIFIHGLVSSDGTVEVEGCLRRGVAQETAERLFDEISSFASYAFNKAHAAVYALVAYQTAYLKCLYPLDYMSSLLTSVTDGEKISEYISECERLGLHVLPPSVNHSEMGFVPEGKAIRFGLLAIKSVGAGFIEQLCRERESGGPYRSFPDFCRRVSGMRESNRRAVESLIQCGALDGLGCNRHQMLEYAGKLLERYGDENRRNVQGQIGFFDNPQLLSGDETLPSMPELPLMQRLTLEKEVAGLYLSGHPLSPYKPMIQKLHLPLIRHLLEQAEEQGEEMEGRSVRLCGMLSSCRTRNTKSGNAMATVRLEDFTGSIELVLFPKVLSRYASSVGDGKVVIVTGRINLREEQPPCILLDTMEPLPETEHPEASYPPEGAEKSAKYGLYLRLSSEDDPVWDTVREILQHTPGNRPVYIRFQNSGKWVRVSGITVSDSRALMRGLRRILGEENVALRG